MTKRELLKEYAALLDKNRLSKLSGIGEHSNKTELQAAIDCLKCTDKEMEDYFTVVRLKYPNTAREIERFGYLQHSFNRFYVYTTARLVLTH